MGSITRSTMKILGLTSNPKVSKIKPVIPPKPPNRPPNSLEKYLNQAYQKVKGDRDRLGPDVKLGLKGCVPISIFLEGTPGTPPEYAGVSDKFAKDGGRPVEDEKLKPFRLDQVECFSGSLPKVAAMFAAYKLRAEARTLVEDVKHDRVKINGDTEPKRVSNFFDKLKTNIELGLTAKNMGEVTKFIRSPSAKDNPLKPVNKEPQLTEILRVTGSFSDRTTLGIEFTDDFKGEMAAMIIHSINCSAGECISRLSYPYINAKLVEAEFLVFDKAHPHQSKGIWLCGDYIVTSGKFVCDNKDKSQAFVRIDTVNDCEKATHNCLSAQNTTSFQMARFFLEILSGEFVESGNFVDKESCKEMRELLRAARSSHLSPDEFIIDGVKIGESQLKKDPDRETSIVYSEGMLIRWKHITRDPVDPSDFDEALSKKFFDYGFTGNAAICYQNFSRLQSTVALVEIITTAISDYIHQRPVP